MKSVPIYKAMFIFLCAILTFCVWIELGVRVSSEPLTVIAKSRTCNENLKDNRKFFQDRVDLPTIYFITPTYPRPEQIPELTRLSHTLMHVPALHWIVADDQDVCSEQVLKVLRASDLPFTHIKSPKPFKKWKPRTTPRGVANRRAALKWLRKHVTSGIIYFGDDDNTLDLQLFDEIRQTKGVSMFPVGLIGNYGVSSPVVKDGKVVGFFDSWPASRTFPVDMAGFAVNMNRLSAGADMPYIAGYEEDHFLTSIGLKMDEIEPLAANCSEILVWHTRTTKYSRPTLKIDGRWLDGPSEYPQLLRLIRETRRLGMAQWDAAAGTEPLFYRGKNSFRPF